MKPRAVTRYDCVPMLQILLPVTSGKKKPARAACCYVSEVRADTTRSTASCDADRPKATRGPIWAPVSSVRDGAQEVATYKGVAPYAVMHTRRVANSTLTLPY